MNRCKICKKDFGKSTGNGRFKNYCSPSCYDKEWRNRLGNRKKRRKYSWKNYRYEKNYSCVICGFKRALDFAHIIPVKAGGRETKDNLIILCPNHHRLFDKGLLTKEEESKL